VGMWCGKNVFLLIFCFNLVVSYRTAMFKALDLLNKRTCTFPFSMKPTRMYGDILVYKSL
jgi:hypothetical protein